MGWLRKKIQCLLLGPNFKQEVVRACEPDIQEIRRQLRQSIQELFISDSGRYNDELVSYVNRAIKQLAEETQANIRNNVKDAVDRYVKSEMFIDHIVAKINNKQLAH